jgi:hypothetical protein
MKNFMIAAAIAISSTSAAVAGDFDNNSLNLSMQRDNLTFGIETVDGDATAVTVDVEIAPHTFATADASVVLGMGYGVVEDDITLSATYVLSKRYGDMVGYAEAEAAYNVGTGDTDEVWIVTPTVGVSYDINNSLTAFGEVSYTWNATDDWSRDGGLVEVGASYFVTETVSLTPSVTRTFDTANDETNFSLELGLFF